MKIPMIFQESLSTGVQIQCIDFVIYHDILRRDMIPILFVLIMNELIGDCTLDILALSETCYNQMINIKLAT